MGYSNLVFRRNFEGTVQAFEGDTLKKQWLNRARKVSMSQYAKLVRDGGSIAKATTCQAKTAAEKAQDKTDKIIRNGDAVAGQ